MCVGKGVIANQVLWMARRRLNNSHAIEMSIRKIAVQPESRKRKAPIPRKLS